MYQVQDNNIYILVLKLARSCEQAQPIALYQPWVLKSRGLRGGSGFLAGSLLFAFAALVIYIAARSPRYQLVHFVTFLGTHLRHFCRHHGKVGHLCIQLQISGITVICKLCKNILALCQQINQVAYLCSALIFNVKLYREKSSGYQAIH